MPMPGDIDVLAAASTSDWIAAVTVMVGSFVAIIVMNRVLRTLTRSLRFQSYVSTVVTRIVGTLLVLIALVYALRQLGVEVGPLLGALGIGGLLIAMSLQPVLGNLVGSVMLHVRRPIRRGDQIHTNGQSGTVIDINGRAVVMMTFNGEMVYLPNLRVLDEPLLNQTSEEFRRTVMPFQVGYEADLRVTQRLVRDAVAAVDILDGSPPADVLVTGFAESGIDLVVRFWHPSEELTARFAISEVAITVRETLAANDITIPFPQRVVHLVADPAAEALLPGTEAAGPATHVVGDQ